MACRASSQGEGDRAVENERLVRDAVRLKGMEPSPSRSPLTLTLPAHRSPSPSPFTVTAHRSPLTFHPNPNQAVNGPEAKAEAMEDEESEEEEEEEVS